MKKITFKTLLFFGFMLCSFCITAQDAPPSDDIFRLKNVETGLFLTDTGSCAITNGKIEIRNNRNLTSGLYIVSAITDDNKTVQTKLIIN